MPLKWKCGASLADEWSVFHLENVDNDKADCTEEAKWLQRRQDCGSSDGKCLEVGQRGHCDGTTSSWHCQTKTLFQRALGVSGAEVVETLHAHEHVVDADAEEEEGNDVVEGAVREATEAAETVCKTNWHAHTCQAD